MFAFSKEIACLIILALTAVSAEQDLIQKRYFNHISNKPIELILINGEEFLDHKFFFSLYL